MGTSRHPRVWFAVAIAGLLAMVAVIWLPSLLPLTTTDSPLPIPDAASSLLPPLAKIGLTLLFVALGAGIGVGLILIYGAWFSRKAK
jgi:cytochrome bd-type quinol oxidase subunit 2